MKYTYLFTALLFIVSCGENTIEKDIDTKPDLTEQESEQEKKISPIQNIMGTWFATAETAGAYIEMTIKEGGEMDYEIAGQKDQRTYEILTDSSLQVGTQVWTFSNVTKTHADVAWKSKSGLGKSIPFTKK